MEYVGLIKDFGPLVGVILFFIWRDWKREEGLVERVKGLEDFNNDVLTGLVKQCASVIATNTEQLRIMNTLMQGCRKRDD